MDLLLINSPLFDGEEVNVQPDVPPLGLGYIATQARAAGHKVMLLDAVAEHLTTSNILAKIAETGPRWLGINVFSTNIAIVRRIVEGVSPDIKVMIGGQAVRHLLPEIRVWKGADRIVTVIGDGEIVVPAILNGALPGSTRHSPLHTVVVDQSSEYYPKDLDNLRLERDFFLHEPLADGELIECHIVTTRGCPHNCAFCGSAHDVALYKKIRERTSLSIISELSYIREFHPQTNCIRILDDLFLGSPARVDVAVAIFNEIGLQWRAMAHLEALSRCSDRQFAEMRASGCRELFVGIESGNEEVRAFIGKKGSLEIIVPTALRLMRAGIDVKGYFILGIPGETLRQMEDTVALAQQLRDLPGPARFRASAFVFRPYHGTKLYNRILASGGDISAISYDGLLANEGRERFSFSGGHFAGASSEEVREMMDKLLALGKTNG